MVTCILLTACEQETSLSSIPRQATIAELQAESPPTERNQERESNLPTPNLSEHPQTQFNLGNKSYLFDVSDHSIEELEALLERAEEITQSSANKYDKLDIVMILHGPDINWFTQQNYEQNKQLVDLAAKLDAYDIIDLKVCETAMSNRGLEREQIPSFIESVPYSPDEMKRLLKEDYINL